MFRLIKWIVQLRGMMAIIRQFRSLKKGGSKMDILKSVLLGTKNQFLLDFLLKKKSKK